MLFYHASHTKIPVGDSLRRRVEKPYRDPMLRHPRMPEGCPVRACYMAPTPEDAEEWCHMDRVCKPWYIHQVYVPDDTLVQIHMDGFWSCDGSGLDGSHWLWVKAKDVPNYLHRMRGMEGEILCHSKVKVVGVRCLHQTLEECLALDLSTVTAVPEDDFFAPPDGEERYKYFDVYIRWPSHQNMDAIKKLMAEYRIDTLGYTLHVDGLTGITPKWPGFSEQEFLSRLIEMTKPREAWLYSQPSSLDDNWRFQRIPLKTDPNH